MADCARPVAFPNVGDMSTDKQSCLSFLAADIELHDADLRLQIQHANKQVRPACCQSTDTALTPSVLLSSWSKPLLIWSRPNQVSLVLAQVCT